VGKNLKLKKQIKMEQKKWSAGAWKKTTAKGEVINFTIENVKYSMWVNSYKTEDKQPDFKIYINDFKPKEDTEGLPF
jgi:hypothetical protein